MNWWWEAKELQQLGHWLGSEAQNMAWQTSGFCKQKHRESSNFSSQISNVTTWGSGDVPWSWNRGVHFGKKACLWSLLSSEHFNGGLPNDWEKRLIGVLFLWRLLVHETFKEDKRSTQIQRSDTWYSSAQCVAGSFFCTTQAVLRVAEHQARVRKPKACGSCCWGARHALVRTVVMLIYIDDDTQSILIGMSL